MLDNPLLKTYLNTIKKIPPLTREQEAQAGIKKDYNKLILHNLRFVLPVAMKYKSSGVSIVDVIQMGNLGLITAARRYDPNKNFKFISYAVWYIRESILMGFSKSGRLVRLPLNIISSMHQYNKLPENRKLNARYFLKINKKRLTTIEQGVSFLSLDAPLKRVEDQTVSDSIPDYTHMEYDDIDDKKDYDKLLHIVNGLSIRKKLIVSKYFGLFDGYDSHLDDIAFGLGISRERARQIKKKALQEIKSKALAAGIHLV